MMMNGKKDIPVAMNGIWESPLAEYVYKLVSENWTELRDTLSELEFEVRLGRIENDVTPFHAHLNRDYWYKHVKMFDGASKCTTPFFQRSGRIMYDVFFHGDVRVVVEEINGKYAKLSSQWNEDERFRYEANVSYVHESITRWIFAYGCSSCTCKGGAHVR